MPYFQEAVEISRRITAPRYAGISGLQVRMAELKGDPEEARRDILSTIEDYKALNHRRGIVMGQSALAHHLRQEGYLDEAEAYYRQSIVAWQAQGHRPAVAHQLVCFAFIAIARGQYEHAARLLGAAKEAREQLNTLSEDPREIKELASAMEYLAEAMGEEERDKVMAEGKLVDLDSAVEICLHKIPNPQP